MANGVLEVMPGLPSRIGSQQMSRRLPRPTGADVIRALGQAGWYRDSQRGSHAYLRHPDRPGRRVTVPVHAGETIKPKTLLSILDQAGLTAAQFRELL